MNTNLDTFDYANIFNVIEDSNGYQYFNLVNALNVQGDIDPQLYSYDYVYSFASFYELSKKYYKTHKLWWTILVANDIKNPFEVTTGQKVKILNTSALSEIISTINNS